MNEYVRLRKKLTRQETKGLRIMSDKEIKKLEDYEERIRKHKEIENNREHAHIVKICKKQVKRHCYRCKHIQREKNMDNIINFDQCTSHDHSENDSKDGYDESYQSSSQEDVQIDSQQAS